MNFVLFPNLSELWSENCGIAILPPGWKHNKRKIDTSVIILGHHGEVKITEENDVLSVRPSTLCVLTEGKTHWGTETIQENARYYWIHIKSQPPPQILSENEGRIILENEEVTKARLADALLLPCQYDLGNSTVMREAFHELLYEQQKPAFTFNKYQAMVRLMLINLNQMIYHDFYKQSMGTNSSSLVNSIIEQIYGNLTNPNFSVKLLADSIGYNPDYLNRHFKSIVKKSLVEFLVDKRIELSTVKMIDSNDSITAIAMESGFSSYRNFIHQFKLRKEATPSEFRARLRMMHITNK